VVKPCCEWTQDPEWDQQNHISQVDLATWHQSPQIIKIQQELNSGQWPKNCQQCAIIESQGRQDSGRGNSNQAYAAYSGQDITLEIRPGSVCNFACQTCWPAASSRVAQFHHQAGMINIKSVNSISMDNFDFLQPIAHRIKNVVLLGGEPFYDPSCKKFLSWSEKNLQAPMTMFTNGSHVDWSWVNRYTGKIVMVFSIDAVGSPAEYVRFGTVWSEVHDNFVRAQQHANVELRVNITASVYNYHLIEGVVDMLVSCWPSVVSFGRPRQAHFCEQAIPDQSRAPLIASLTCCVEKIQQANIDKDQQHNAINACQSIINNLQHSDFDPGLYQKLQQFVSNMDQVKQTDIKDSATPLDFS
jgi:hypothetical protein